VEEIKLEDFCKLCRNQAARILDENVALKPKPKKPRLPNPEKENWVSLRDIFGTAKIPETVAQLVADSITRMIATGDIGQNNKWQWLEYVAVEKMQEDE